MLSPDSRLGKQERPGHHLRPVAWELTRAILTRNSELAIFGLSDQCLAPVILMYNLDVCSPLVAVSHGLQYLVSEGLVLPCRRDIGSQNEETGAQRDVTLHHTTIVSVACLISFLVPKTPAPVNTNSFPVNSTVLGSRSRG